MSKELFNQLLSAIRKSPGKLASIFYAIKINDPELKSRAYKNCNNANILRVMDSGIFHEGGLKGKSLPGKTSPFRVYPIINLSYFILIVTNLIVQPEMEEIFQESISDFDTAIEKIEGLKYVAQFYRSWVSYKKLEKIIQELTNIKSILLSKPNPNKLHFRIGKSWRQDPDRIDKLIKLFEEQVPEAPPFTIGRAIHKLLSQFGIPSTEAAITQRIYRKNKRK